MTDAGTMPRALTIAGSDSGGGAGIEADLKTFTVFGVYGMAAITSVTAQNTKGVLGIHNCPAQMVGEQIDAVMEDIGADAVKSGMLATAEIIEIVAERLRHWNVSNYVLDPVMIAGSGDALLEDAAVETLKAHLVPRAFVVTPNIPEAEALTGIRIGNEKDVETAARVLGDLGAAHIVIKGGHVAGDASTDWLYDGKSFQTFSVPRVDTKNTHGTGCTYAAAIAAGLAQGLAVAAAVGRAKEYVTGAIRNAPRFGQGMGPLNHMWDSSRSEKASGSDE